LTPRLTARTAASRIARNETDPRRLAAMRYRRPPNALRGRPGNCRRFTPCRQNTRAPADEEPDRVAIHGGQGADKRRPSFPDQANRTLSVVQTARTGRGRMEAQAVPKKTEGRQAAKVGLTLPTGFDATENSDAKPFPQLL